MIWDLSNFTIIAKLLFNTTRFYNDVKITKRGKNK